MSKNSIEQNSILVKLAKFKEEKIEIVKNKKAFGYSYAPLDEIIPKVQPILEKLKISYVQSTLIDDETKQNKLVTVLYDTENPLSYVSSETIIKEASLAKMNDFMVLGAGITYFRRYHLVVMLGLLTEEDNDATGASASPVRDKATNFVLIFEKMISNNKPKEEVVKSFNNYKTKMTESEIYFIEDLIEKSY